MYKLFGKHPVKMHIIDLLASFEYLQENFVFFAMLWARLYLFKLNFQIFASKCQAQSKIICEKNKNSIKKQLILK